MPSRAHVHISRSEAWLHFQALYYSFQRTCSHMLMILHYDIFFGSNLTNHHHAVRLDECDIKHFNQKPFFCLWWLKVNVDCMDELFITVLINDLPCLKKLTTIIKGVQYSALHLYQQSVCNWASLFFFKLVLRFIGVKCGCIFERLCHFVCVWVELMQL